MGLWAIWSTSKSPCSLQDRCTKRVLKVSSNPNYSMVLLNTGIQSRIAVSLLLSLQRGPPSWLTFLFSQQHPNCPQNTSAWIHSSNSPSSQAAFLCYKHSWLFVHVLFVAMGFKANQALNILHFLKWWVQLLHKEAVRRQPHHEKRIVILTASSHISHCSTLYTCVLAGTDQIFACQSFTELSL